MSNLDIIKAPVNNELEKFNKYFKEELKSNTVLLDIISNYVISQKGKQIRPLLVFLSAKLNGGITQSTYSAAVLIELMHTATLIHDDVVDNSFQRRGLYSVNAIWKNKIAVLIGDYFLAKGLLHSIESNEFELLRIVSEAVKEMSEGELLQIKKVRLLNIDETAYFEIIRKKTASLISAAMVAGATSSKMNPDNLEKIKNIGYYIGIVFQIRDDIFDYECNKNTGKSEGNDIKEQKITLPVIYVLNNCKSSERHKIISIIKNHNHDKDKRNELIEMVNNLGGVDYSKKIMSEYKDKALELLSSFPHNDARESFEALFNYIIKRNN